MKVRRCSEMSISSIRLDLEFYIFMQIENTIPVLIGGTQGVDFYGIENNFLRK